MEVQDLEFSALDFIRKHEVYYGSRGSGFSAIKVLSKRASNEVCKGAKDSTKKFEQWRKKFRKEAARGPRGLGEGERRQEREHQQLLPGIPDDITLNLITPKLPWKDLFKLSSVSPVWLQAFRSRQVYDARVRSNKTKRLYLCGHFVSNEIGKRLTIGNFGPRYILPQFPLRDAPHLETRFMIRPIDGRIYAVGGYTRSHSLRVFVLDLAAQKPWKECASLLEPIRMEFGGSIGSIVKDGKLYVFGGTCHSKFDMSALKIMSGISPLKLDMPKLKMSGCGAEVYDPNEDSWSSTKLENFRGRDFEFLAV